MGVDLSFLILTYNIEEWLLKRCIDSILAQNLNLVFEIIVVDDGSETTPEEFLETYNNDCIRYYEKSDGGRGPGAARNIALSVAWGTYITFVDSDDYLFPGSFGIVTESLLSEMPDILRFEYKYVTGPEVKDQKNDNPVITGYESGGRYMIENNLMGANCGYIIRKDLIDRYNIRYIENILHEDEDFITKSFFYAGKTIKTNIISYAYYKRDNSIVRNQSKESQIKRLEDFRVSFKSILNLRSDRLYNSSELHRTGLEKKIAFLTIDYIIKMLNVDDYKKTGLSYLSFLYDENLLPLPDIEYGKKYKIFRNVMRMPFSYAILKLLTSVNERLR